MALIRFTLDLAIPQAAYAAIPAAKKTAIRDQIRALKAYAVKINAGAANEEFTVKASYHICNHDTGGPCEQEFDV